MSIEQHFNKEKIDIKKLVLEPEKEPVLESQKMYEKLKETVLYDKKRKQWRGNMRENQELEFSDRSSSTQLMGILVESLFNKQLAQEQYKKLKETPLYNKEAKRWRWRMNATQRLELSNHPSRSQLLGVIVESLLNKESAKEMYRKLKQTPLYDKRMKHWLWYTGEFRKREGLSRFATNQLLGVWAEFLFDEQSAKSRYERLKEISLYDEEKKQWNETMNRNQVLMNSNRSTDAQLFGVLAESLFDKESARELYENLKKTSLYDKKRKQWNAAMNKDQELTNLDRCSGAQLLGIFVHHVFEEKPKIFKKEIPPLPKTRRF